MSTNYQSHQLKLKFVVISEVDPCDFGKTTCGPHSSCVVENDSFRCVCSPGYQYLYLETNEASVCQDINECQSGLHDCDVDAQCVNELGSYSCTCNPGFEGNGHYCQSTQTCQNVQCHENAECVENGPAVCRCLAGFTGNGQNCYPVDNLSCHIENNCSPYGICSISQQTNEYSCSCLPGYQGDGYNCQPLPETTTIGEDEPVTQYCFNGDCSCPSGYSAIEGSEYCSPETTTVPVDTTTNETMSSTEQGKLIRLYQLTPTTIEFRVDTFASAHGQ